jgi:uncharacterized membrane protein
MTAPHASDIINGYLARLETETVDLPRRSRRELIDGVREHIAEARTEEPQETDASLLTLLDRLGDPADLAEDERERLGIGTQPRPRTGLLEIGALVLTPLIWPVGVILLWASSAWDTRDKLIGTLLPPGGLFVSFYGVMFVALGARGTVCSSGYSNGHSYTRCSGGLPPIASVLLGVALILFLFLPVITGVYMAIRLRRGSERSAHTTHDLFSPSL